MAASYLHDLKQLRNPTIGLAGDEPNTSPSVIMLALGYRNSPILVATTGSAR